MRLVVVFPGNKQAFAGPGTCQLGQGSPRPPGEHGPPRSAGEQQLGGRWTFTGPGTCQLGQGSLRPPGEHGPSKVGGQTVAGGPLDVHWPWPRLSKTTRRARAAQGRRAKRLGGRWTFAGPGTCQVGQGSPRPPGEHRPPKAKAQLGQDSPRPPGEHGPPEVGGRTAVGGPLNVRWPWHKPTRPRLSETTQSTDRPRLVGEQQVRAAGHLLALAHAN
ncbi:synapsin-1-like [Macrobrachium rosenbergii]|uniref:synapsin-1-like n=1 Tax=Macrobrachium rosenbergii TaxID=79674 RepID=UPI0034D52762